MVRAAGVILVVLLGGAGPDARAEAPGAAGDSSLSVSRAQRWATGMLEVVSAVPGAQVRVDGDMRGRTPVRVAGLQPGTHVVEVGTAGAPSWRKDVTVSSGSVVRVSVPSAGSPSDGPTLISGPTMQEAIKGWVGDNPVLLSMFRQPWAYASAAAFGGALLASGVMWTASPSRFPVVGKLPFNATDVQWRIAQWGVLGLACALALSTVVLFVLPGLPIFREALAQDATKPS